MAIKLKSTLVKYLVVSELSSINKREIKTLTGSAIANEVKFSKRNYSDWGSILHRTLINAMRDKKARRWIRELKIYELDDNAYSTMYALKDDQFIAALSLSEDLVNRLDGLLDAKSDIEHIVSSLNHLIKHQNDIGGHRLKLVGITLADAEKYEAAMKDISDNYARVEYEAVINEVNEIMKSSW
ncbi:MAG: hypothetical protein NTU92_08765 [Methylotenera sp.]|nr:hypothetical protein [Methylotenera sp.]